MTYYIQCPKCGDIIETTNYLPKDIVCYNCGKHYIVTNKNSMKRPPYEVFPVLSFLVLGISIWFVGRVLNQGAPSTELFYAAWYAISAVAITVSADYMRNKTERSIRKYGMERVRKGFQRKSTNNRKYGDKIY